MSGSKFSDPVRLPRCKTISREQARSFYPWSNVPSSAYALSPQQWFSIPLQHSYFKPSCLSSHRKRAAKALQRHYLVKHGRQQAQANFKVEDWPGEQNTFYTAEWWCGLQRIQPGSASGTQAQESWHRWKLKKYLLRWAGVFLTGYTS